MPRLKNPGYGGAEDVTARLLKQVSSSIGLQIRGLSRDQAARYVGVSASKFDGLVTDGRMPKPKRVDGRVIWDRLALDVAFDDLDGEKSVNPWKAAIEANSYPARGPKVRSTLAGG